MKRIFKRMAFLGMLAASCQPCLAADTSSKLEWTSIKYLTDDHEKQSIQAELDNYSCSGVPLRKSKLPASVSLDFDPLGSLSRICNGAQFARLQSQGGTQLLLLQFDGTGSCGDDIDVIFKVDPVSGDIKKVVSATCGGGLYEMKHAGDEYVLEIIGGIQIRHGKRVEGNFVVKWDGGDINDISPPPQPR